MLAPTGTQTWHTGNNSDETQEVMLAPTGTQTWHTGNNSDATQEVMPLRGLKLGILATIVMQHKK
jgi:hypothetical protein